MSCMKSNLIILGQGIGGKLSAYAALKTGSFSRSVLIGPEDDKNSQALFYINRKIQGLTLDDPIEVTYSCIGSGSLEDYQYKSRGYFSKDLSTSSFNKVGTSEKGYILRDSFYSDVLSTQGVERVYSKVIKINLDERYAVVDSNGSKNIIFYDVLISTLPLSVFCKLSGNYCPKLENKPVYLMKLGEDTKFSSINVYYDLSDSMSYRTSVYKNKSNEVVKTVTESIFRIDDADVVLSPGKIIPSSDATGLVNFLESKYRNVKLVGRYARWSYHYTVDRSYFDTLNFINNLEVNCGNS